MSLTPEQFGEIVELHKKMIGKIRKNPAINAKRDAREMARRIEEMIQPSVSEGAVAPGPPSAAATAEEPDRTFSDFFKELGDGMLETQHELDRRSNQYLESIKGSRHLLPSVFRIPEVKGKLKVGFEKEGRRKLNFIVFGKSSSAKEMIEHEVDFKLTSVPPPPDALQELAELPAALTLVLNSGERLSIFEAIVHCLNADDPKGEFDPGPYQQNGHAHAVRALSKQPAESNETLLWIDGNAGVLLVAAYEQANGTPLHGAWRLELSHTRGADEDGRSLPHRLTPLWRVSQAQRAKEYEAVDSHLRSAYEAQRRLLENLPSAD